MLSINLKIGPNVLFFFFLSQPTPCVSLRQQGSRQTGRAQRPRLEGTPDWVSVQADGAYLHRTNSMSSTTQVQAQLSLRSRLGHLLLL